MEFRAAARSMCRPWDFWQTAQILSVFHSTPKKIQTDTSAEIQNLLKFRLSVDTACQPSLFAKSIALAFWRCQKHENWYGYSQWILSETRKLIWLFSVDFVRKSLFCGFSWRLKKLRNHIFNNLQAKKFVLILMDQRIFWDIMSLKIFQPRAISGRTTVDSLLNFLNQTRVATFCYYPINNTRITARSVSTWSLCLKEVRTWRILSSIMYGVASLIGSSLNIGYPTKCVKSC